VSYKASVVKNTSPRVCSHVRRYENKNIFFPPGKQVNPSNPVLNRNYVVFIVILDEGQEMSLAPPKNFFF
jgi:hypothetical protein